MNLTPIQFQVSPGLVIVYKRAHVHDSVVDELQLSLGPISPKQPILQMKALVVSWGSLGTLCCETKALVVIQEGLSDLAPPPVHHPKHPILGFHGWMKLSPRIGLFSQ